MACFGSTKMDDEEEEEPVKKEDLVVASSQIMPCNWKKIGLELGLTELQLGRVSYDNSNVGVEEMIYQMLLEWKQSSASKATKRKLKNTLEKFAYIEENSQKLTDEHYADYLLQIQSVMENTYTNLELPRVSWYDYFDKILPLKDYYVNLLLEGKDIYGNETMVDIELEHIFDKTDSKPVKRILIEGHPGYGKTTLICKLASDWANGCPYIREKFDLLFVVLLREFDGNLGEILLEQCDVEELTSSVKKDVIARTERKTLLLMDGFDELNETSKNKILPVIQKKAYKLMTVVVTSRTEEMHLKEMKKTHLASIGAKTKDFSFLSLWDKRIQIKGISEENRQRFLEMYFDSDPKNIHEEISHLIGDELHNLYECPLFLLLLAVLIEEEQIKEITTKTELYQKVVNFIVNRYLVKNNFIGDQIEINVFNFNQEAPSFNPLLLVWFGELALDKLQADILTFSEEELLKTCEKDHKILHLGFLRKNTILKRKRLEFWYEPIHKTFLEFLASVYVFHLSNFSDKSNFMDKIISLFKSGFLSENSLFCSFLVGLLGNEAHQFLKLIHSYVGMFFESFVKGIYPEMEKTEENNIAILPFIPTRLYLLDITYFPNSLLQSSFLEFAIANNKIDQLYWDLSCKLNFPHFVYVPKLVIMFSEKSENGMECLTDKIINCNQLILSGELTPEKWEIFKYLLKKINFNVITFKWDVLINPTTALHFRKEVAEGNWKNLKIDLLECNLAIPEMLSLSKTLVKLSMVNSLFGYCDADEDEDDFTSNIPIQKIVDASITSNSLKMLFFPKFSDNRMKIQIDLSQLCTLDNKTWRLLHIDQSITWVNYDNCEGLLPIEAIVFDPVRDTEVAADCYVLDRCTCLHAISLSTELFYQFAKNAPSDWSGFSTVSEIHLFAITKTSLETFRLLSRFQKVKKLIIDDFNSNIDPEDADNLIMCISEFALDILCFRRPENGYVFLVSFLEQVSGQTLEEKEISETVQQKRNMFKCRTLRIDFGNVYPNEETDEQVICLSMQLLYKQRIDKIEFLFKLSPFNKFLFHLINPPYRSEFKYSNNEHHLKNDFFIFDFEDKSLESISVSLVGS